MSTAAVAHRTLDVDGVEVFYREAGPADAPLVLLAHGYPSSSFQFRRFIAALGDRWRQIQAYLREYQPPTLIAWGPHDGYMPEGAGRAYLRDLPDAELHLLDGGHWALETNLDEIVALARAFLGRVHA